MEAGLSTIYFTIYFLFGLLGMFVLFKPIIKKYTGTLEFRYTYFPFIYIWGLYALGTISAYFLTKNHDFIEPLNFGRVLAPLVLAPIIFLSQFWFEKIGRMLIIVTCVALEVYLQPVGTGNSIPDIPVWMLRCLLIFFFSVFCLKSDVINSVPHTFVVPNIVILIGLCVLTYVGAVPLYVSLCAVILMGCLIAYLSLNFQNINIDLDSATCSALTFLVSSLLLMNLGEFSFPSCFVFTAVFWSEFFVALWQRFVITHTGTLQENTYGYFASQKYDANTLVMSLLKVGCVVLFIGWFQLFAKNYYSLTIVAILIASWLNGSLGEKRLRFRDLKDINHEFVQNLKEHIDETKQVIRSQKEDKK